MKLSFLLAQLNEIVTDEKSGITMDSEVLFSHGAPTTQQHIFVCQGLGVASREDGEQAMFFDLVTYAENELGQIQREAAQEETPVILQS